MKTLFSMGFQPYNPFSVSHPSMGVSLGAELDAAARQSLVAKINAMKAKWAQVDAWLNSRFAVDPTLIQTFKQQYVVDNVYGYLDIIRKDESEVDMALQKAASPLPINWDFTEDRLSTVDQWGQVVDILYAAMQEYGGVRPVGAQRLPATQGPTISPTTGMPIPTGIMPGASVSTPPPSSGIPTGTLVLGGAAILAAIGLAALLKA
jgi:hypothetical protein